MGAASESISYEKGSESSVPEAATNHRDIAPFHNGFDPVLRNALPGNPAEVPDVAEPYLRDPALRTLVLQRAQRGYGNRASQHIVMRARALQRRCSCGGTCSKCQAAPSAERSGVESTGHLDSLPASGGHPLDSAARTPLENYFNADLSDVRVHTDGQAARSAASIDALAYTAGRDIYFAAGGYAPASGDGKRLLAHEVAHVVQQSSGHMPAVTAKSAHGLAIGRSDDPLETEADLAAEQFVSGVEPDGITRAGHPAVQRKVAADPTKVAITPQIAADMTDTEITAQLALIKTTLDALQPTAPEYETIRKNRRAIEDVQITRNLKNAPTGGFATTDQSLEARVARFKLAVLTSAYIRLSRNQENLDIWRTFITTKLSALELQKQAYGQTAMDLYRTAEENKSMRAFNEWSGEANPYMRWVFEQQAAGKFHACTGCHLIVRADSLGKQESHFGPAWQTPAQRLSAMAGIPGFQGTSAASRISNRDAEIVKMSVAQIRPVLEPLGEYGYKVIPSETMSLLGNAGPEELRTAILGNIDHRKAQYQELKARIINGDVKYFDLTPILSDMLAMASSDVADAIRDELKWEQIKAILTFIGTLIATLLSFLIPPLGLAVAAFQFASGWGQFKQGQNYMLGTGAYDVFTREQQDMAGSLMASGVANMAMAAGAIVATTPGAVKWTAGAMDWTATNVVVMSDAIMARNIANRALAGPIPEAELLAMQRPGLLGRTAQGWTNWRGYQILYRGQGAATAEILSPLGRQGGLDLSRSMYDAMKAQGLTDLEIAGMTAKWSESPVPAFATPPGMTPGQPLGGVGIPTTRLPNIASGFAGEGGVIYVLRVPKNLPVEVGTAGWGRMSVVESEYVIFHQIPNGFVVRTMPASSIPPLEFVDPAGVGPALAIPATPPTAVP